MISIVKTPLNYIEQKIDATAMYRVVSLSLGVLAAYATLIGFFGLIPYTGFEQIISFTVAALVALSVNFLASKVWRVAVNQESALITALIVHFLVIPAQLSSLTDTLVIAVVVTLAVLSKYIFAWHKQHLANPAAVGLVLVALAYAVLPLPGYFESSWWIGRPELFLPLLLCGAAVVTKVRKWTPVLAFLGVGFLVFLFEEWRFSGEVFARFDYYWLSGPSVFLAFFMLTEPFTLPPTKKLQAGYGALIGFFSQTTLFLSMGIKMTPELALVLGNILFFPATLRRKLIVPLVKVYEVAKNTFEFSFAKPAGVRFKAGQYMEWMLPHSRPDSRGVRRYFTIASAPAEETLRIAVRFGETVSSYKQALKQMQLGDTVIASQLAGDFTLPEDTTKKLAFIAGGIGITPFMSHLSDMQIGGTKFDTVLFYGNNTEAEIAYRDQLQAFSHTLPLKTVHVIAKEVVPAYEHGYLNKEMIEKYAPDYQERFWYVSGPPGMVNAYKKLLQEMKVPHRQIVCDFFPGLA